jgi:hypothetical protein
VRESAAKKTRQNAGRSSLLIPPRRDRHSTLGSNVSVAGTLDSSA